MLKRDPNQIFFPQSAQMCLRYIQKRGYIFEWKQRKQVGMF